MVKCELCGEPMPAGEEMFKYHGYSGPCPNPPLPVIEVPCAGSAHHWPKDAADGDTCNCGEWYRFRNRIERPATRATV